MYFDTKTATGPERELATGTWILDPDRSGVEFRVPLLFGAIGTVKGGFSRYRGTLGDTLHVHGTLRARGGSAPLDVTATVRPVGDELEIEANAEVDQRELGMTYSPLGTLRPPPV